MFQDTAPRILAAIEEAGHAWTMYEDGISPSRLPPAGDCVIFWGSLNAAYSDRVAAPWSPGAVGDPDRFRCSVYRPHLGPLLANADSVLTTVRALVDDPRAVSSSIGDPKQVFVRPDSPLKPFSGRTLDVSSLSLEALDHGYYYDDERLPILVSTVKAVTREWRFVLAEGQIVAGCEYGPERRGRGIVVPQEARALAGHMASADWQPAPLYIADIGELDGSFRILELNPFSGADLYECDAGAVVRAASRVASRIHRAGG